MNKSFKSIQPMTDFYSFCIIAICIVGHIATLDSISAWLIAFRNLSKQPRVFSAFLAKFIKEPGNEADSNWRAP